MKPIVPGSLDELLSLDGIDFVAASYRDLLKREPDETGLEHHLGLLARGVHKLDLLVGLADSEEALVLKTSSSPLAMRARGRLFAAGTRSHAAMIRALFRAAYMRRVRRDVQRREVAAARKWAAASAQSAASTAVKQSVHVNRVRRSVWEAGLAVRDASDTSDPTLWMDLTMSMQWSGGVVGIVRTELELACGMKKLEPGLRFSMQVDQGFVEIRASELEWLLSAQNVTDAYMNFFGRYSDAKTVAGAITVEAPDKDGLFYPYKSNDVVIAAGWMDSQKESYYGRLKEEISGLYLCYLIYDVILLRDETRHFYDRHGSELFKGYLNWISHTCDFVLYGGETAKSDTERLMREQGWPVLPGRAVKFGTDIVKLPDSAQDQALLKNVGVTGPFMMTVGSIEPRKNHETLYRAYLLAMELSEQPLPQLFICGRPLGRGADLVDTLDRDPRLAGKVVRVSPSDTELAAMYKHCLLTLLPSVYEGWSLTLPESLGQGKFCIASDTPPLREIGGRLIDYVEPYDVRGWAEKILLYAANPDLLATREKQIAKDWPQTRWADTARMVRDYVREAVAKAPPSKIRPEERRRRSQWKKPTIWMDLTTSYIWGGGNLSGVTRAELMFAKYLKELAPETRFFAFEDAYFFEIDQSKLSWLFEEGDLSVAYAEFHNYWAHHEKAGTGYRNPFLMSRKPSPDDPAYLPAFPSDTVVFFAGIDSDGTGVLQRNAQVAGLMTGDGSTMTAQLIYDLTPILLPHLHTPETCKGFLPFAEHVSNQFDYIVYGGAAAQQDGLALQKQLGWRTPPNDYIRFGSDIAKRVAAPASRAQDRELLASLGVTGEFVLSVGTIEPRKNHEVLYKAFLCMAERGLLKKPIQMVFAGRRGWNTDNLLATIEADERVEGKILLLTPSDVELDALYRHCLITLLPSFYEGWSLTLPESLSYGKLCLTSDVAPLREVGGDLAEYLHPLDPERWAERIAHYADSPQSRSAWERRIKSEWRPLGWREATQMLLGHLHGAHRRHFHESVAAPPIQLAPEGAL